MARVYETRYGWGVRSPNLIMVLLLVSLLVAGCGPSGPRRIKIEGKVTFDGAPPPADGSVYFATSKPAPGFPGRSTYANFSKGDGSFTIRAPDNGLMPGTYRVTIECWKQKPGEDGTPGRSYIPAGYVPPEIEVKVDDAEPVKYEIDVRR